MKILKTAGLKFISNGPWEDWRVQTLLTKEEGTIKWLQENVKNTDVFYDVGANIGIYTMFAAQLGAAVYAFEPHIFSAASLLRNVELNGFRDRVKVVTCALHAETGFYDFNYKWLEAGSSGSQLGHCEDEQGGEFVAKASELKWATCFWSLIIEAGIRRPNLIKIDVDGNELELLQGLGGMDTSLRSLQVEVHPKNAKAIDDLMKERGFVFQSKHHTSLGKEAIQSGLNQEKVFYNAIYALGQDKQASVAL